MSVADAAIIAAHATNNTRSERRHQRRKHTMSGHTR